MLNKHRPTIREVKPRHRVSRETISRWIRQVMFDAGKDVNVLKPHSVCTAATYKAKAASVPLQDILERAGWSSSRTFDTFYNKRLKENPSFDIAILDTTA